MAKNRACLSRGEGDRKECAKSPTACTPMSTLFVMRTRERADERNDQVCRCTWHPRCGATRGSVALLRTAALSHRPCPCPRHVLRVLSDFWGCNHSSYTHTTAFLNSLAQPIARAISWMQHMHLKCGVCTAPCQRAARIWFDGYDSHLRERTAYTWPRLSAFTLLTRWRAPQVPDDA